MALVGDNPGFPGCGGGGGWLGEGLGDVESASSPTRLLAPGAAPAAAGAVFGAMNTAAVTFLIVPGVRVTLVVVRLIS